jgi:hypothetical protein
VESIVECSGGYCRMYWRVYEGLVQGMGGYAVKCIGGRSGGYM